MHSNMTGSPQPSTEHGLLAVPSAPYGHAWIASSLNGVLSHQIPSRNERGQESYTTARRKHFYQFLKSVRLYHGQRIFFFEY